MNRNVIKTLASLIIVIVLIVLVAGLVNGAANADNQTRTTPTCVPSDAWTETIPGTPGQHYSLRGNSGIGKDEVPVFPADYWQANTEQEPPGHLHSTTWIGEVGVGLHFASHGPDGEGKRDWFYFNPPTPDTIIEHPAKECPTPTDPTTVPTETESTDVPCTDLPAGEAEGCEETTDPTDVPTTPTDPTEGTEEPTDPVKPCHGRPVVGGPCLPTTDVPEVPETPVVPEEPVRKQSADPLPATGA